MAKSFVWHYENAGAVFLRSEAIAQACEEQAARMTRATGMEYKADVRVRGDRVRAMAYDKMKHEDGQYRKRGKGKKQKMVYTQNRVKKG